MPAAAPDSSLLSEKVILLISPQPWDHIFISKHHYAEELARRNTVYFLEPPTDGGPPRIRLAEAAPGVTVVSWGPTFPRALRFHAYWLYRLLIAAEARRIARALGGPPDVVWCFDFNLFPDLGAFGAPLKIFHPVDPLTDPRQAQIGVSADLIVSVSQTILANFSGPRFEGRTLLVNHGLSRSFAALADSAAPSPGGGERRVGFFGNLDRKFINAGLIERLAREHPGVIFHLWGPYAANGRLASTLGSLCNVVLHGRVDKETLAHEVAAMDCFILPYGEDVVESDRSNAHKLLEYMSTGKIIVSCPLHCYADAPDMVRMPERDDDDAFADLFGSLMSDLDQANAPALIQRRKAFAKQFTYAENLKTIDRALAQRLGASPPRKELMS